MDNKLIHRLHKKDTNPIWSILICSLHDRKYLLDALYENFKRQILNLDANIEVLVLVTDESPSIGEKRNWLLQNAKGDYISFFDDDDLPSNEYVSSIFNAIQENPDVITFKGDYKFRNEKEVIWVLKLGAERNAVFNTMNRIDYYVAPPNHIAVTKREIVLKYKFKEISMGEDNDWADQIAEDQVLKKEIHIDKILYHYVFTK